MLFVLAEAVWLQYHGKRIDYFGVRSLVKKDAFLKRYSPAVSAVIEGQASQATAAAANDPGRLGLEACCRFGFFCA